MEFKRGIWVEAESSERPLEVETRLELVFSRCREWGITDVYLQVYRGGFAWYRSSHADLKHIQEQLKRGFDPLEYALGSVREKSIRVHAWVNVFNLGVSHSPQTLAKFRDDCFQVDSRGRSIFDCREAQGVFQLDTPGVWLDPSSPHVYNYVLANCGELLERYHALDGLHLDFIRYPYFVPIRPYSGIRAGYDFGYSPQARARYAADTGRADSFIEHGDGEISLRSEADSLAWDEWRRKQVARYLRPLKEKLRSSQKLSIAAIAWPERAYLNAFQDWPAWAEEGAVDEVLLMSYTADRKFFSRLVRQACLFAGPATKVLAGVGVYKLGSAGERAILENLARAAGSSGVCAFSYSSMMHLNM